MNTVPQLTDIINCAIEYVNEFPELKNYGLKVDTKDCQVETAQSIQKPEIGASSRMMLLYWKVHIKSNIFPGSLHHFIAIVEREVGGNLAVTDFFPGE